MRRLLVVLLAAAVAVATIEPSDEELRCLLAEDTAACPAAAPPAVAKLLRIAPDDLRTALATEGLRWTEVVALRALGPALLPLLPLRQLRTLPASAGAELLRRRPDAAGLAAAVVHSIAHDAERRRDFLEGVSGSALGARVEEELGRWAAETFSGQYDDLALLRRAGSGLVASLPAAHLAALSDEGAGSFVFSLRAWHDFSGAHGASTWRRAPPLSRRAWAALALRIGQLPRANDTDGTSTRWTRELLASHGFLLEGSAPGEAAPLPMDAALWPALAQLAPPPLTARAALDAAVYSGASPPPLNISLRLAPAQLARLIPGHALRKAWANSLHAGGGARPSAAAAPLGSARAAALLLAASSGGDANGAGALAWALPPALRARLRAPSAQALSSLDSPRFSRQEADRLLSAARDEMQNSSGAWLQAHGLLRGLRASALAELHPEQLPQPLLLHLLRAFPRDAPPPAALALLQRVRRHLGSEALMNATLAGSGAGVLLGQLTPYELRGAARTLLSALPRAPPHTLRTLPDRVFWAALDAELGDEFPFPSADAYTPSLLGLRCKHLQEAGPALAAPLLDSLNAQLRAARRPYPVALRRCARQALADLLTLRAQTLAPKDSEKLAMAALRPQDAEAFGGYVVAGVDPVALSSAPVDAARALVSAAGRLPLEELLEATGGAVRARALAEVASRLFALSDAVIEIQKKTEASQRLPAEELERSLSEDEAWLGVEALDRIGSLRWLLPAVSVQKMRPKALRILLEAPALHDSRVICADEAARTQWAQLLIKAFGPLEDWTAGTLGSVGGIVTALSHEQRSRVPLEAWAGAADALAAAWPFSRRPASTSSPAAAPAPGAKPSLLEACAEGLGANDSREAAEAVRDASRRLMQGAKQQLRDARPPGSTKQEATLLREAHAPEEDDLPLFRPPPVHVLPVDESAAQRRRRRNTGDELRASVHDTPSTTHMPPLETTTTAQPDDHPPITSHEDDWCGVVQLAGPAAGFVLSVADIHEATPSQLRACAETLGALELSPEVGTAFWERAIVGATKEEGDWAADAGALLAAAPPQRLRMLALRRLDVKAAVAQHFDLEEMMTVAAQSVWSAPSPSEPLPAAALAATGAALCALPEDALSRRAGGEGTLAGAAAALGVLPWPACPRRCLQALARLLTKSDALGSADRWGTAEAQVAGALAAGLRSPFKSLSADAVAGLTPAALKCIPAADFDALTDQQVRALHPATAAVVSDAQMQRVCCEEARAALHAARTDALPAALTRSSEPAAAHRLVASESVIVVLFTACATFAALARAA